MSVLVPLALLGCLVAAATLLSTRRQQWPVPVDRRVDALGRVARHTARWQLAGLIVGLLGAASLSRSDRLSLGRGVLLAAPAFGLCVLVGVLIGEATAIRPPSTPTRTAAIETRRTRDYLPPRLAGMVTVLAGMLALLLTLASWNAASDDLGRAGRALRQVCDDGTVALASPWPGTFYSAPLALTVAAGLLMATLVLRRVVRRPRLGVDAELRALDDSLRRRTAEAITAACGTLVAVPLAGNAAVSAVRLLVMPCTPAWARMAGAGLLVVALGALGALGWFAAVLLAPVHAARPAHNRAGPR